MTTTDPTGRPWRLQIPPRRVICSDPYRLHRLLTRNRPCPGGSLGLQVITYPLWKKPPKSKEKPC